MEIVEQGKPEALVPSPADAEADRWLDMVLEETFPASDPITAHFFG